MKKIIRNGMVIVFSLFVLMACREEDQTLRELTVSEELAAASEVLDTENLADEDMAMVEEVLYEVVASQSARQLEACRMITIDSAKREVVIDFGEGCVGPYGRERAGKILITFGGEFNEGLGRRTVTFDGYQVNNRQITGTIEVSEYSQNEDGNYSSTRTLIDYTIVFPNGVTRVINGSNTREFLAGFGDGIWSNNVVSITGSYTTETSRGWVFNYDILEPVILDYACLFEGGMLRKLGVIEITRQNASRIRTKMIDYGESCDNSYTVTIGEETINIEG